VAEDFVRKGAGSRAGTLSPGLFNDMAAVLCTLAESMPFTRETVPEVDVEGGWLRIAPPEGLFE